MSASDYYTFYLMLTWQNSKVSVKHVTPTWRNGEFSLPDEQKTQEGITSGEYNPSLLEILNGENENSFKLFGEKIADLLLPGNLRGKFLDIWDRQPKIRLCLLHENNADKLLKIPWEYIYLPPKNPPSNGFNKDYLLALNPDISIVHWLHPYRLSSTSVEKLRVEMKYLSWFKEDEKRNEDMILNEFVGELPELEPVLHCTNIGSSSRPLRIEDYHASPIDVIIDSLNHHFIQLTSHGDLLGVALEDGRVLKPEHFDTRTEEHKLKVVILLNCNSDDSIARRLHELDVPMVVGINGSIDFRPASNFVSGLYSAIATWPSHGFEEAVVYGRKGIYISTKKTQFGYPRLFLRNTHSTLIPEDLLYGSDEMVNSFREHIDFLTDGIDTTDAEGYQQKLKDWVQQTGEAPDRRWYLVTGQSGSGKSTQIAQLLKTLRIQESKEEISRLKNIFLSIKQLRQSFLKVIGRKRESPTKLVYHFCLDDQPQTGDPLAFVQDSLVPQLKQHFEKYKDWCPQGRFPLLAGNADNALTDFVYSPLLKAKENGKEDLPVIVIDGIDFIPAGQERKNSILHLLLRHRDRLDDVARFLVTADASEEESVVKEDIRRLTYHQYELPDIVLDRSASVEPSPLFERIKERIKDSGIIISQDVTSSQDLDKLIKTVIDAALQKKQDDDWSDRVRKILDVVTLAYEPLSICDVAAIINTENAEMKELLTVLSPLFLNLDQEGHDSEVGKLDPCKDKLILFHPRLRTYLFRDLNDRKCVRTTHDFFVKVLRPANGNWADITDWSNLRGTAWEQHCSICFTDEANNVEQGNSLLPPMVQYAWRYLAHHAYERYQGTDWSVGEDRKQIADEFLSLVCDPDFRTVRFVEIGQEAALQDIWNGLRVVYTQYALLSDDYDNQTKVHSLNQLIAVNTPDSLIRDDLIELEETIRQNDASVRALFEALKLNWNAELQQRFGSRVFEYPV